jgi:hypothetical protein
MTKITTIDKKSLIALRAPIEAALAELAAQTGLKFTVGSGSFGGANGHLKLEIAVDDPAVQEAKERATWNANGRYIGYDAGGLRPEDFGTEFVTSGTRYRTCGLALSRSKYPIKVEVLSGPKKGKVILFTDGVVRSIRAATDAAAKVAA